MIKKSKIKCPKIWSTKNADSKFSKWIRSRDGKCVRCGNTENLQCSHFWPRANSSTRFDPENCDALCYRCHYGDRYHGFEYAKQGEYRTFKINQLGQANYDALESRYRMLIKRRDAIITCMDLINGVQDET